MRPDPKTRSGARTRGATSNTTTIEHKYYIERLPDGSGAVHRLAR